MDIDLLNPDAKEEKAGGNTSPLSRELFPDGGGFQPIDRAVSE